VLEENTVANQATKKWQTEVKELLARAAELCAEHDVQMDPFLRRATAAYLDARPGMREYLEEKELEAQLEELRQAGRMAEA
jgi:hypothetical protein